MNEDVEKRLQIVDDFSSSESENEESSDDEPDDEPNGDNDEHEALTNEFNELYAIPGNQPTKVNLDVSTLICLVSELTHGGHIYRYPKRWLEIPAELERASHLVPKLESYMKGKRSVLLIRNDLFRLDKELYICQTAYDEFSSIVKTVGGPNEKKRAEELFQRVNSFVFLLEKLLESKFS